MTAPPRLHARRWACIAASITLALALLLHPVSPARAAGEITVGSKAFPEGIILGDMLAVMLTRSGVTVNHRSGLGGTQIVWQALLRGDIDVYADYTGTLQQEQLHDQDVSTPERLQAALDRLGLVVSAPLGFSNSYSLAVRRPLAERLGLRTISDLARHHELVLGFDHEFMTRNEGWKALQKRYDLHPADVVSMEHELLYRALAADQVQAVNVYTTDADIGYYDLVVLEDDRHLFPRYDAVYVYRKDAATRCAALTEATRSLAGSLDAAQMIHLNAAVKVDKRAEADVARAFIAEHFGPPPATSAESASPSPSDAGGLLPARFWSDTRNHLYLVGVPLLLDICVGVPLGVLASRRPRLGQWIVGVCGVMQTIPSLALLIFMVPLLGIGYTPALVALFVYGLLPILRNTCTGLRDISPPLLESARALGLPARVRLLKIELPLASRAILAGIKTSAVINVGTATIGAIVGAGGYGEPIMMGVRRDDMHLLLQGAVPSACLAILVQMLFDQVERWLVPRGLRVGEAQRADT